MACTDDAPDSMLLTRSVAEVVRVSVCGVVGEVYMWVWCFVPVLFGKKSGSGGWSVCFVSIFKLFFFSLWPACLLTGTLPWVFDALCTIQRGDGMTRDGIEMRVCVCYERDVCLCVCLFCV